MKSKLELAKQAVADLKTAADAGEDITKGDVDALNVGLLEAQNIEILKALTGLPEAISKTVNVAKAEQPEDADEKEFPPKDEDDEEKAVLLDLALEEIVRLRKQEDDEDEDEEEAEPLPIEAAKAKPKKSLSKQADEDEEVAEDEEKEAVVKGPDPGPAADLPKTDSDDYTDSKESVQKSAEFQAAVQKATENILKSAGFVASSTPAPIAIAAPGAALGAVATDDLTKAWDTLTELPWKSINKFRMEVDPALQNLSQNFHALGTGRRA